MLFLIYSQLRFDPGNGEMVTRAGADGPRPRRLCRFQNCFQQNIGAITVGGQLSPIDPRNQGTYPRDASETRDSGEFEARSMALP